MESPDPTVGAALMVALTGLSVAAVFQLALALGAPWGQLSLGGRFPGRYPPAMRVVAVLTILLYGGIGLILGVRAGALPALWWPLAPGAWAWGVFGLWVLSFIGNLATPIRWERRIWAPVTFLLAAASFVIASR